MSKRIFQHVLVAVGLLLLAVPAFAQTQAVFPIQPGSKLWVEGTSNKSDWSVNATEFAGSITMNPQGTAQDPGVQQVKITIPSAKILSNKSTIMDRLMHDALQVEAHPQVVYTLTSAKAAPGKTPNTFALQTQGQLTLAGTTKDIEVIVQGERMADGQVRFTGSHKMKMTDYGMAPPSAMFGALRTADDVTVRFDLVVAPAQAN